MDREVAIHAAFHPVARWDQDRGIQLFDDRGASKFRVRWQMIAPIDRRLVCGAIECHLPVARGRCGGLALRRVDQL